MKGAFLIYPLFVFRELFMSDQRLPSTRHEVIFWLIVSVLAIIIALVFMQRSIGIW
jgi:hypothetical protein